jgi:hypothetical protein
VVVLVVETSVKHQHVLVEHILLPMEILHMVVVLVLELLLPLVVGVAVMAKMRVVVLVEQMVVTVLLLFPTMKVSMI